MGYVPPPRWPHQELLADIHREDDPGPGEFNMLRDDDEEEDGDGRTSMGVFLLCCAVAFCIGLVAGAMSATQ